jgi:hypothetical protein
MSRRYRRNGTPIGKYKVYALAMKGNVCTGEFEIMSSGVETYEDIESLVMLEMIEGKFGAPERLIITKPGADLRGINIFRADWRDANLQGANLQNSTLFFAKLQGADLSDAKLQGALLQGAKLQGANLLFAQLQGATLDMADLSGADLQGANLGGTKIVGGTWDSTTKWPKGIIVPPSR